MVCDYFTSVRDPSLLTVEGYTASQISMIEISRSSKYHSSVPVLPLRRSGDSWSTQSSKAISSNQSIVWNPRLFARDVSEKKHSPSTAPHPLFHDEVPGVSGRNHERSINATILPLACTDVSFATPRSDPFYPIPHTSTQKP